MNIGFVSTRFAGTDGVSLETAKLAAILGRLGHKPCFCAGELAPSLPGMLVPEMHFAHPVARRIHDRAFPSAARHPSGPVDKARAGQPANDLQERIAAMAAELKGALGRFVERFSVDVLFPQNALAIPMHLPLGVALTEFITETGIPAIAHHHDFAWERERFAVTRVPDILERCFPPHLPPIRHMVISSLAQAALHQRRGITSCVLPNVFDFETPPPEPDPFATDLRRSLGLAAESYLILQPTRVVPRKGIELSIELLRRLNDARCVLLITHPAGDEGMGYLRHLQDLAEQAGVNLLYADHRFGPTRRVAPDGTRLHSLWDAYLQADFVTFPSLAEGFGNALLETIYFRRPALVNRYPVYAADIGPLGFSFVEIEGHVTDEAVLQTRRLLDDPGLGQEMADHNYALARRHFSYSVARKRLRDLLKDLKAWTQPSGVK